MLTGRESEFSKLKNEIEKSWKSKTPLSIYISGAPGTGKTATMKAVIQSFNKNKNVIFLSGFISKLILIFRSNASVSTVSVLTKKPMLKEVFYLNLVFRLLKDPINPICLKKLLKKIKRKCRFLRSFLRCLRFVFRIIVLDEIDHLDSRRQSLLYSAFGWPHESDARVTVIGIANSLDLTERLLPKLKVDGLQPVVFAFQPYTRDQIKNILAERYPTVSFYSYVHV